MADILYINIRLTGQQQCRIVVINSNFITGALYVVQPLAWLFSPVDSETVDNVVKL